MAGLNQSFKKVFVTTNNTLLASGSTYDLAAGQIGIFNADDYVSDATPTWTEEKALIIAEGTPDLSGLPKGAFTANESNKTVTIVGKKITGWKKKVYSAGANHIVAIGYDGVDTTKTMSVKCDEVKHIYLRLTGKSIEDFIPGGHIIHVEGQGPCCDTCGSNCADVDPTAMRDEMYTRLTEYTILGGVPLSKFVLIEKTNGTDSDGNAVVGLKFTSAFTAHSDSNTCYFNIFPYNADPIHIEVSEYNPDWHGTPERCDTTFPVTELQAVAYPFGAGGYVMRYEAENMGLDLRQFSDDIAVRQAYGQYLNTNPAVNYDKYTLSFEFSYHVLGWSQVYTDRYDLEVFVQTGQTAYKTAINSYVASVTGLGIAGV